MCLPNIIWFPSCFRNFTVFFSIAHSFGFGNWHKGKKCRFSGKDRMLPYYIVEACNGNQSKAFVIAAESTILSSWAERKRSRRILAVRCRRCSLRHKARSTACKKSGRRSFGSLTLAQDDKERGLCPAQDDRSYAKSCAILLNATTHHPSPEGRGKWRYMHMGIRYACLLCSEIIHILVEISTFPVHKPFTQVNIHPSKVNYPTFFLGKRVL